MKLDEVQEAKLHNNWEVRKIFAKKITSFNGYDIMDCNMTDDVRVFYILKDKTPVGYVYGHKLSDRIMQISSTYITPVARRQGLALMAYEAIVGKVDMLISDYERSEGAEALWQKLIKNPAFSVRDNGASRYIASKK